MFGNGMYNGGLCLTHHIITGFFNNGQFKAHQSHKLYVNWPKDAKLLLIVQFY